MRTAKAKLSPSLDFERALRLAALGHRDQVRKGSEVPYVEHPLAVALILDRAGFDEQVVIAGLLHDLVEDTEVTIDQIRESFGSRVAEIVSSCSETKTDALGAKQPWIDRKRDHLAGVVAFSTDARAVILADKLHNLLSIHLDLVEGQPVWSRFNAGRDQVLWYYRAMIDACATDQPRLAELAEESRKLLDEVTDLEPGNRKTGQSTS